MRDYGKDGKDRFQKCTKAEVDYRHGNLDERCELCTMFCAPHGCALVEGKIKPSDVCDYFKRK